MKSLYVQNTMPRRRRRWTVDGSVRIRCRPYRIRAWTSRRKRQATSVASRRSRKRTTTSVRRAPSSGNTRKTRQRQLRTCSVIPVIQFDDVIRLFLAVVFMNIVRFGCSCTTTEEDSGGSSRGQVERTAAAAAAAAAAQGSREGKRKSERGKSRTGAASEAQQESTDHLLTRKANVEMAGHQFQESLQGQRSQRVLQSHSSRSRNPACNDHHYYDHHYYYIITDN